MFLINKYHLFFNVFICYLRMETLVHLTKPGKYETDVTDCEELFERILLEILFECADAR